MGIIIDSYEKIIESILPPKNHPMYDSWKKFELTSLDRSEKIVKEIQEYTVINDKKILDLGCGTCAAAITFAKRNAYAVGLDYCTDVDDKGRLKLMAGIANANKENCQIHVTIGDGLMLPFKDKSFDIIICSDVIEHVPRPVVLIKEISRVLKPNGILYLSCPNKFSPVFIIEDPHFGLFGLTLMPRSLAEWYIINIRKLGKEYMIGYLPTYRFLERNFQKNGIELENISKKTIAQMINNNYRPNSPIKRTLLKIINTCKLKRLTIIIASVNLITPNYICIGIKK
ncbi:MAG TPA: class I SAM-dependent methyltransferase [Prolixibacteraceae bacterium]|jgi:ubiquinone/menaquinone biosynthesis C-methylase UbiE